VCDGKAELYYMLFEPSLSVQNSSHFKGVQKTETAGFCLEGEQLVCGFGKMKLAILHPNFNYMFTFEMTLTL